MKKICLMFAVVTIFTACKTEKEEKMSMSFPEGTKTHCVGRHTLDVPISFLPNELTNGVFKSAGLSAQDPSFEVTVREAGSTPEQFDLHLRKRRAELAKSNGDTVNVLRAEKTLGEGAILFRVQEIDDDYVSEIHALRGSSIVRVSLESYRGQFLSAEEALAKFIGEIKAVGTLSAAIPAGFCLGSVIMTGDYKEESGSFLFRDSTGSAFALQIETYTPDASVPLLKRVSGSDSLLAKFDVRHTVLRARERTVAGMRAQEWLGWTKLGEQGDQKTFGFTLETMRATAAKSAPSIHLSLDTGQALEDGSPTSTLISDHEAIRLWDSVVESIRPARF